MRGLEYLSVEQLRLLWRELRTLAVERAAAHASKLAELREAPVVHGEGAIIAKVNHEVVHGIGLDQVRHDPAITRLREHIPRKSN